MSSLGSPAKVRRWSRAARFLYAAVEEALAARPGFEPEWMIFGTTSGGMEFGEEFYRAHESGAGGLASAARRLRGYLPQTPLADIARIFRAPARVRVISNACASGADALGLAWQLVSSGLARRVLAGGYDALSQLVYSGFDCLQALSPTVCRPFDRDRDGLALGEGAAAFCLENEGPTLLAGYGAYTDIHHLTQPEPSGRGPFEAMKKALASAGCEPGQVEYVNAHGTATPQNDACEARALARLCPGAAVTSTKSITGHALGAAGAIEAAFSSFSITEGFLPPTLNFCSPDPGVELGIVSAGARKCAPSLVVSNSFGFGGANASLVFRPA